MRMRFLSAFVLLACPVALSQAAVTPVRRPQASASKKAAKLKSTSPIVLLRPNAKVAINKDSGVYHCEHTTGFEQTMKKGLTMTQREAVDKGYRPAFSKPCE
jgi:hypothetical protein